MDYGIGIGRISSSRGELKHQGRMNVLKYADKPFGFRGQSPAASRY